MVAIVRAGAAVEEEVVDAAVVGPVGGPVLADVVAAGGKVGILVSAAAMGFAVVDVRLMKARSRVDAAVGIPAGFLNPDGVVEILVLSLLLPPWLLRARLLGGGNQPPGCSIFPPLIRLPWEELSWIVAAVKGDGRGNC